MIERKNEKMFGEAVNDDPINLTLVQPVLHFLNGCQYEYM